MTISSALPEPVMVGTAAYRRIGMALFLAGFSTFALLYCAQPLLPMFASYFQVGAAESSLALSVSTFCLSLAIMVAAVLSEGYGRRSVIVISSEMPELLGICDRICVMNAGVFVGEFGRAEATQEKIMRAIVRKGERLVDRKLEEKLPGTAHP